METSNLLQPIADEVVFFDEDQYTPEQKLKYIETFNAMVADGCLEGKFEDYKWVGYSGIKRVSIDFAMNKDAYDCHLGKKYGISFDRMLDMIKCYAVSILSVYIFPTINKKIGWLIQLATMLGDGKCRFPVEAKETLCDFLCFIGTPQSMVITTMDSLHFAASVKTKNRELSHLLNYLVIANEINDLYKTSLPDELYIKWFPIFFWTNITFVIPLRATEMTVTPMDCISHNNGETRITLRRTNLKGGKRKVYHNVERDYKLFTYLVPNGWVVEVIEGYQKLTSNHERKYLFDYSKYSVNKIFSLKAFNDLLEEFINTHLIRNPKYGYAKFAAGIKEFEIVTAGDSRPIAMANLYFQDISVDICRQLANHSQISTSFGYYTNVSNTIHCASIMKIQKLISMESMITEEAETAHIQNRLCRPDDTTHSECFSPNQPHITGNIKDCIEQNHIHECVGCKYYSPSKEELKEELEKRKKKLDEISHQFVEYIAKHRTGKEERDNTDKLFLDVHTGATRLKVVSDEYAEEAKMRWRRHKSTEMNCS